MMRSFAVVAFLGMAACWLQAQAPSSPTVALPQYPTVTLSFGSPELTPLGKKGTVMLGNTTCTPDGTLFLEMADSPWKNDFVLHSLTDGTEDVRYAASMVPGYARVSWPLHYFVASDSVVALAWATPRITPSEEAQDARPQDVEVALIYDRKGTLEHVVPLPSQIDPKSIGMYSSGDLLIISKDASTNRLHLLVLDRDGDIKNELSLFDYDYDANRKAGKKQPLAELVDAANFIQIIPHGDNLLLVPQLTTATVIEVNEQGIVRATDIDLPPGHLLRSLFTSDGPYWTVSTYDRVKIMQDRSSRESYPVLANGPLFQFNSFDGSLLRRINKPENVKANILCAHSGDFTAVTTDKETGRLEILTGSVPR